MERHRILVVDDERDWLDLVEPILADKYEVICTVDPREAVRLAGESFLSLAILDRRLSPDLTGVDLLQQLWAVRPGLRAIILTGFADVDDVVDSIKQGAFDYLSKGRPNLEAELKAHVEQALAFDAGNLQALLGRPEGQKLELKSSLRWDRKLERPNPALEAAVVRTVAGFLNSGSGGTLVIGVDDERQVVGLEADYQTFRRRDRDGFELFLKGLLLDAFGRDLDPFIRIDIDGVGEHEVCRVEARPAARPVFVESGNAQHFYLRTGNATRELMMGEAFDYCRTRWKE